MSVLIAQPQAMLGEGVARVVRGVAPRAVIVARGKDELLASIGADAEAPAAVSWPIRGFHSHPYAPCARRGPRRR